MRANGEFHGALMTPEQKARAQIDYQLEQAGWAVQDTGAVNLYAAAGVAVREFALQPGHGVADYLLYVIGKAAGVVEAKPVGATLTGVEFQSEKYGAGLPPNLPAHRRPLPFLYESTGAETQFTNGLDPEPRSRRTFAFHKPETLAEWLGVADSSATEPGLLLERPADYGTAANLRRRLRAMPPLDESALWSAQARAIRNLERSLAEGRPPRAGTDGHRQRQNVHGLQPGLSPHPARWRAARPVPGGPRQPGTPDPARVPRLFRP